MGTIVIALAAMVLVIAAIAAVVLGLRSRGRLTSRDRTPGGGQ